MQNRILSTLVQELSISDVALKSYGQKTGTLHKKARPQRKTKHLDIVYWRTFEKKIFFFLSFFAFKREIESQ